MKIHFIFYKGKIMKQESDIGKLILRVSVGFLMLFHGIAKISGGIAFVERMLEQNNLPQFFSYGVYFGEVLAPIMLILGFQTRIAAFVLMVNMFFVIYLTQMDKIFSVSARGGAWGIELPAFYFLTALAIFFIGAGKYAIDKEKRYQ